MKSNERTNPENWKAPEDYFDTFEDRLLARLEAETQTKSRVIDFSKYRNWIGAAAAVLVLTLGTTLFFNQKTAVEVPNEVIESYLVDQEFSSDLWMELDIEDLQSIKNEALAWHYQDLEDYLISDPATLELLTY